MILLIVVINFIVQVNKRLSYTNFLHLQPDILSNLLKRIAVHYMELVRRRIILMVSLNGIRLSEKYLKLHIKHIDGYLDH